MVPKNKKRFFLLIFIFGLFFFFSLFFFQKEVFLKKSELGIREKDCENRTEERIVRGSSLSPILEPGQEVKIIFDYYKCNEIKKEDIIVLNYEGNPDPLVKIIKGLPGDSFHLKKEESGWNLLINEQALKNSEGKLYIFDEKRQKMLALYERDYQGKIPSGTFLVLGNDTSGSVDSSYFGLVSENNILGKVYF